MGSLKNPLFCCNSHSKLNATPCPNTKEEPSPLPHGAYAGLVTCIRTFALVASPGSNTSYSTSLSP